MDYPELPDITTLLSVHPTETSTATTAAMTTATTATETTAMTATRNDEMEESSVVRASFQEAMSGLTVQLSDASDDDDVAMQSQRTETEVSKYHCLRLTSGHWLMVNRL